VVNALRPATKVSIVFLGLIVAAAIAWAAVVLHQRLTDDPDAQASSGMYALGDLVLGVAVFGVLALVPIALALYWLRPVARFWSALLGGAMLFAVTGFVALAASVWTNPSTNHWLFLAHARIGLMPLGALALTMCAIFAPQTRHRWLLLAAAVTDGTLFAGLVLVKYVLPGLDGG
jgi:hypothetical protein